MTLRLGRERVNYDFSSYYLHQPPPTSTNLPNLLQAVASTFGKGGTSRNHSPASREFLSTSTSRRSATRMTVATRWRPTRMCSTDSDWFFSTVSAVSTSTAATRGCDLRPGNTTRPSLAGSGIGRVSRVRMSSGHVTTRSEEHTSELQSLAYLVCRLLLEKKKIR